MNTQKKLKRFFSWTVVGVLIAEFFLRAVGTLDFPLYDVDSEIGYIPKANQSGCFLRTNDWIFNSRHMGTSEGLPQGNQYNILLISDSIVYGGNHYKQSDKLGPALENAMGEGYRVWPVGAGSWGALNEITYLERNRDLLPSIQHLIWIVNSGDFSGRSAWISEAYHPTSRPISTVSYIIYKYVWYEKMRAHFSARFPEVIKPISSDWAAPDATLPAYLNFLDELRRQYPALKVTVVGYPGPGEFMNRDAAPWKELRQNLHAKLGAIDVRWVDGMDNKSWRGEYYRDFIHPTVEGNRVLAHFIAEQIQNKN